MQTVQKAQRNPTITSVLHPTSKEKLPARPFALFSNDEEKKASANSETTTNGNADEESVSKESKENIAAPMDNESSEKRPAPLDTESREKRTVPLDTTPPPIKKQKVDESESPRVSKPRKNISLLGLSPKKLPTTPVEECSNSNWSELQPYIIGTYRMSPLTVEMQQRLILQYLTPLGEYQEVIHEYFLINESMPRLITSNNVYGTILLCFAVSRSYI